MWFPHCEGVLLPRGTFKTSKKLWNSCFASVVVWGSLKAEFNKGDLRGPGGLHEFFFQKSNFCLFLIEEIDIYQMLLVLWKNIVPSRSYRWSKVRAYVCDYIARSIFNRLPWKTNFKTYLLPQFLSNHPQTFRICSGQKRFTLPNCLFGK